MDDAFSQRAEDPDTQTCFAYNDYSRGSVVKHNYILAIERNERGRKLKGPARSRRCVCVVVGGIDDWCLSGLQSCPLQTHYADEGK